MIRIEDGSAPLAKVDAGEIEKPSKPLSIGWLEQELITRFPREDAEAWDRMGLLVGDPAQLVKGVAVGLDPTVDAIRSAKKAGANVLLTHHPAFLDPPSAFSPSRSVAPASGAVVFAAIHEEVALLNIHTALDVSADAMHILPGMLNMSFDRVLVPIPGDAARGYGQFCVVRPEDKPFKLGHLAARCTSVFGRAPRVWGDYSKALDSVVVANGSAGGVIEACVKANADCLLCGEIRYHAALDAAQAGLSIVEVGHDVSELPLTAVLAQAAIDAGVRPDAVTVLDQSSNWSLPDATRI